jgi:hypothetical protein
MSRRDGFTLLEICLAVFIGLMIISLVVPSMDGLLSDKRLMGTFDDFDRFVRTAQLRSVQEMRGYQLVWEEESIALLPIQLRRDDDPETAERYSIPEGRVLTIERPAALMKDPPPEWPFWKSGTCEPVRIFYTGPEGKWVAEYDALTARGTVVSQEAR